MEKNSMHCTNNAGLNFRRILILNTRKAIEDALVKHASSFSGRPGAFLDKYHSNIDNKGKFMHFLECTKKQS